MSGENENEAFDNIWDHAWECCQKDWNLQQVRMFLLERSLDRNLENSAGDIFHSLKRTWLLEALNPRDRAAEMRPEDIEELVFLSELADRIMRTDLDVLARMLKFDAPVSDNFRELIASLSSPSPPME